MSYKSQSIKIDKLPDRIAHLRKIAERIKLDHPEFASDDPSHAAECGGDGYRVVGPESFGSGRGPHA